MHLQNLQLEFADNLFSSENQLDCILPAQNMRLYQQNVLVHLIKALRNTYPLILRLVGDDFFQITAKAYIKQYPSRSGDLNDYGEYFSDFLAEYQPLKDLIYLAEVAQFEWTCHVLLSASSPGRMDVFILKNLHPDQYEQIHFQLHPACKVMKFYYPMLRIIELCEGNVDDTIDLGEEGIHLLIIRRHLDISLIPLTDGEFTFLSAIQENKSLAEALSASLEVDPMFSLEEKLSAWIQDLTIVDCALF
jgi:hypothetical protein